MADISIEETNRVRLALGMAPLPVPGAGPVFKKASSDSDSEEDVGSTLESRQAQGYENWQKAQEETDRKKKAQTRNEAIKKARDTALRNAKLKGKGLGDEDEEEVDTKTWLLKQKKRQKKLEKERARTKKMEEELRAREEQAYTSRDLAGVKVAHEVEDFDLLDGEQVLTLKDTTIDENEEEGDELENSLLREREKLGEKLDLKKKKPVYNPNDFDDSSEQTLLAQYDETIDGKKRKRFTLDAQGSTAEEREAKKQSVGGKVKPQAISLDFEAALPISDYQEPKEAKFKKPVKKKSKNTRKKVVNDDDLPPANGANGNEDSMEVDSGAGAPVVSAPKRDISSFVDDDDLQASLAKTRREALKKRKKVTPEDIARQIREEAEAEMNGLEESREDNALVINDTIQFLDNVGRPDLSKSRPNAQKTASPGVSRVQSEPRDEEEDEDEDFDMDTDMDPSYNAIEEDDEKAARIKAEESTLGSNLPVTGLEEEPSLERGLAATFGLLTSRGLLEKPAEENLNALHLSRQKFANEKRQRENAAEQKARQQRERDRASGKFDRMSAREREEYAQYENKKRDQDMSRQAQELFNREYKPDVQLKYVDEFGRHMNQKEAFKDLSHKFHGKGSGKQKTEKRLKKIAEEQKRESQSVLDSGQGAGLNAALDTTTKKNKQAGVRLA